LYYWQVVSEDPGQKDLRSLVLQIKNSVETHFAKQQQSFIESESREVLSPRKGVRGFSKVA
jgi:hypothetical protein